MKRLLPILLIAAGLSWGWHHQPEPTRTPFSRIVTACHAWRSPALYQSCVRQVGEATGWEVGYFRCDTCPRDAEGRIHRSSSARHAFMVETGHPHGWPGHVIDHIKPLACGGADTPSNLQWQTIAEGKAKDKWELNCRPTL
jgi:hypothetical protein